MKKVKIVLGGVLMLFLLSSCGRSGDSTPAPAMDTLAEEMSTGAISDETVSTEEVYDEGYYSVDELVVMWSSGSLTKEDIEYKVATGEISYETYEEFLSYMADDQEFDIAQSEPEIIMVVYNCNTADMSIQSVNPGNGEMNIISSFTLYQRVTSNSDGRRWINMFSNIGCSQRAPLRGMFSKDYKYIAMTRISEDTQEFHAGYYDEENRFYDATVAVDAVGGDFDEPVNQISIGFTEDGHFVFAELPAISLWTAYNTYDSDWKVYQVDLAENGEIIKSSMKPYDSLDKLQGDNWEWLEEGCEVTDWINETHCILNYPEKSAELLYGELRIDRWGVRVFDTQTQEYSSLIPSEARTNWSGIISPDGRNVAFLSAPKQGNGNASLYYVPIGGGEPVKICDDISVGRTSTNNVVSRPNSSGYSGLTSNSIVFLTEWTDIQ